MILRRTLASILIAGLALLASTPASAQKYTHEPLDVLSAENVLSTPVKGQLPYRFGDEFYLERQNGLSSQARKRLLQANFEIRIFRLGDDGKPAPWKVNQDDCDIYLTLVFKGLKFSGDRIDLGPLSHFHWLRQKPNGAVESGRFLIVVAQETRVDKPSSLGQWEIFRLQRDTGPEYFKGAVRIEVKPVSGGGPPLPWPDDETRTKQTLDRVANMISKDHYCYQAVRIANLDSPLHMASLACGASTPAPEDPPRPPRPVDAPGLWTPTDQAPASLD